MYRVYHMNHHRGAWELQQTVKTKEEAQAVAKLATMSKVLDEGQELDPRSYTQVRNA